MKLKKKMNSRKNTKFFLLFCSDNIYLQNKTRKEFNNPAVRLGSKAQRFQKSSAPRDLQSILPFDRNMHRMHQSIENRPRHRKTPNTVRVHTHRPLCSLSPSVPHQNRTRRHHLSTAHSVLHVLSLSGSAATSCVVPRCLSGPLYQ